MITEETDNSCTISGQQLTVLIATHDQARELERNLPLLMEQHYEPGFEVIVVDESSTDDTEEVFKQLKSRYSNFYATYIPASSHYVSRRKLSLTIGMKAAHYEWIIITEPNCKPNSEKWLSTLSEVCTNDYDVVCGYTGYNTDESPYYSFRRIMGWWRQGHKPYRYDGANLAIRKSVFMARNGFLHNLQLLRGEYDFLVNETPCDRIAIMKEPEGCMCQEKPSEREWHNAQLFALDTRKHLNRKFMPRLRSLTGRLFILLSYLCMIASIGYAVYLKNNVFIGIASCALFVFIAMRILWMNHIMMSYNEHISWWKLPFFSIKTPFTDLYLWLSYKMANRNDFTRK